MLWTLCGNSQPLCGCGSVWAIASSLWAVSDSVWDVAASVWAATEKKTKSSDSAAMKSFQVEEKNIYPIEKEKIRERR